MMKTLIYGGMAPPIEDERNIHETVISYYRVR